MKIKILLALTVFLILAYIGVVRAAYSANITPIMMGYSTPPGIVSASSENVGASSEAWKAFDHSMVASSNAWVSMVNVSTSPQWLLFQFMDGEKTVAGYQLSGNGNAANMAPKTWQLQGSNNGSVWTNVDSRTGVVFANFENKQFAVASPGSYSYYRLHVTETGSTGWFVAVPELEMYTDNTPVTAPALLTLNATNIAQDTATANVTIFNTGGASTSAAIYWGTSPGVYDGGSCVLGTVSPGDYSCEMTGLISDTVYYFQASAANSAGTTAGGELFFATLQVLDITASAAPTSMSVL